MSLPSDGGGQASDKDRTPNKKGTGSTGDGQGRKKTSILSFFLGDDEDDDDPEPPAPLVPVPAVPKQDKKEYMKTVAMRYARPLCAPLSLVTDAFIKYASEAAGPRTRGERQGVRSHRHRPPPSRGGVARRG